MMTTIQEFKTLIDFITILTVFLFALTSIFFLDMCIGSIKIENEVFSLSPKVQKNINIVGISTWSRVNGRLSKKLMVNDIEDECDGGDTFDKVVDCKDLDSVKKDLLAKFDVCHSLFKNKLWYRKNSRLVRRKNLY